MGQRPAASGIAMPRAATYLLILGGCAGAPPPPAFTTAWPAQEAMGAALPQSAPGIQSGPGSARGLPLYSPDTVRFWEPDFRDYLNGNFAVLAGLFSPNERRVLAGVRIDVPVNPSLVLFQFASHSDGVVAMPAASLLFLKDLATAQAWLTLNKFSTQPVFDYLAILRQGRLQSWPANARLPLDALGVPAHAANDPKVKDARDNIFNKCVLFILGHELGHLRYGLTEQTRCQALGICDKAALQTSEETADAFAVDLLIRLGIIPDGSTFFFAYDSRLQSTPWDLGKGWSTYVRADTHPLDSRRVQLIASALDRQKEILAEIQRKDRQPLGIGRIQETIRQLNLLADSLDDRSGLQTAWAKSLDPQDLLPRRTLQPALRPTAADRVASGRWNGYFRGDAHFGGGGELPMELVLRSSDARITGEVMMNGIRGRLEGAITEGSGLAVLTWSVAGDQYRVTVSEARDELHASYQSLTHSAAGTWTLRRTH